jgi:hypothetical protein
MINKSFFLFMPLFMVCCTNSSQERVIQNQTDSIQIQTVNEVYENPMDSALVDSLEAIKIKINLWSTGDYNEQKQKIKLKRQEFATAFQNANDSAKSKIIEEAGNYLFDNLLNKIIPYWYKMPWDLSGYSNIPQEGTVGCSYFISNTLLACGFNLNRYRLAQTDPIAGSRSLTFTDSLVKYRNGGSMEDLSKKILKNHPEGLYIIGLDIHVGYLLIYKSKLYFIHSAYYYPNGVCLEYFEKSIGIQSSTTYYITPITTNKKLIEKWITNEFIFIQKPVYMKVDEVRWNKQ